MLTNDELTRLWNELDEMIIPVTQEEADTIEALPPAPVDKKLEEKSRIWFEGFRHGFIAGRKLS